MKLPNDGNTYVFDEAGAEGLAWVEQQKLAAPGDELIFIFYGSDYDAHVFFTDSVSMTINVPPPVQSGGGVASDL